MYFILHPFLQAILASFVLAYVFYPIYTFFRRTLRSKNLAALLVSVLVVLVFSLPIVFVANSLSQEARVNYVFIKKILATGDIVEGECDPENPICRLEGFLGEYIADPQIKFQLTSGLTRVTDFFVNFAGDIIFSIPLFILNFCVMVFIIFYLLKEGDVLVYRLKRLIPLKQIHRTNIFDKLKDVTFAVIYGHITVVAGQAAIGGLALWIFGVRSPFLWAIVMFFFGLIPFLGTGVVWVPAVIFKAINQEPGAAIGLLIVGLFISTADNFIKPKIISGRADVHPVLVLLGVIGGLLVFGGIGIIVGPVILSLFITFIEIYEAEHLEAKS